MRENEKNCPRCCEHPGQQLELEGFSETTIPVYNHSTKPGPISSLLSHGQENAVSLRQLKEITGRDGRTVRMMIQRERLNGTPILSDNFRGYFLPGGPEDQERFVKSMKDRATEILRTAEAVAAGGTSHSQEG